MCNHIIKSGEQCKVKKVNEFGFCCRHLKSRQATKDYNESEDENINAHKVMNNSANQNVINIKKKNSNVYDDLYEKDVIEEPIDNEELQEIEVEKKPASPGEIKFFKYCYLSIIGFIENKNENFSGVTDLISKDELINEALAEVATDYQSIIGLANVRPDVRLLIYTTMAFGMAASVNKKNTNTLPSMNNDNEKNKREIEETFADI